MSRSTLGHIGCWRASFLASLAFAAESLGGICWSLHQVVVLLGIPSSGHEGLTNSRLRRRQNSGVLRTVGRSTRPASALAGSALKFLRGTTGLFRSCTRSRAFSLTVEKRNVESGLCQPFGLPPCYPHLSRRSTRSANSTGTFSSIGILGSEMPAFVVHITCPAAAWTRSTWGTYITKRCEQGDSLLCWALSDRGCVRRETWAETINLGEGCGFVRAGQSCFQGTPMRIKIRNMGCVFEMDSRLVHALEEAGMDATLYIMYCLGQETPDSWRRLSCAGSKSQKLRGSEVRSGVKLQVLRNCREVSHRNGRAPILRHLRAARQMDAMGAESSVFRNPSLLRM